MVWHKYIFYKYILEECLQCVKEDSEAEKVMHIPLDEQSH